MSEQYNNTDTGALFKHDKKGNDKAPDYSGPAYDSSGKKRRCAAWIKKSAKGDTYMSLKFEDERSQNSDNRSQSSNQPLDYPADDDLDSIPF